MVAEKNFASELRTRVSFRKNIPSTTVKGWSSAVIHLTSEEKYASDVYGYIKDSKIYPILKEK